MRGYIQTCDGAQFALGNILSWEITLTGGVPCDEFCVRCAAEGDAAPVMERAVRFFARRDGEDVFCGVVDAYSLAKDEHGAVLCIEGRGMAALLLDNEVTKQTYQRVTAAELIRTLAAPLGIRCGECAPLMAASFEVEAGASVWGVLESFAKISSRYLPYMSATGVLSLTPPSQEVRHVIGGSAPMLGFTYESRRYGVISEILVLPRGGGYGQTVRNERFCALGGSCRRVVYLPAKGKTVARVDTPQYQIEQSEKDARVLRVTLGGRFDVFPGECVEFRRGEAEIDGVYRTAQRESVCGSGGERTIMTLWRE